MSRRWVVITIINLLGIFLFTQIDLFAQQPSYRFESYTIKHGLSHNRVNCTIRDELGYIWIGTLKGLNRFDGYDFKVFTSMASGDNSLSNDVINSILEYDNGTLLVGTVDGLNVFNSQTEKFYSFYKDSLNDNPLLGDYIYYIYKDEQEIVWLCTNGGLQSINVKMENQNPQIRFNASPFLKVFNDSINDDVLCCFRDQVGNLWIGTQTKGLYKLDLEMEIIKEFTFRDQLGFEANQINSINECYGDIWVGTNSGLYIINGQHETRTSFFNISSDIHSLSGDHVQQIIKDSNNLVWLATFDGLSLYNQKDNNFINYRNEVNNPYSLSNNFVHCIFDDGYGSLWIGTESGGQNKLDQHLKAFHWLQHDVTNKNSLSGNIVNSIATESGKGLWVGTSGNGLNFMDSATNNFTHYYHDGTNDESISGDVISAIFQDKSNRMWFGTWGWGLNLLNVDKYGVTYFSHPLKEPYNFISGITQDKFGRLWVSTSEGVVVQNEQTGEFTPVYMPHTESGDVRYLGDIKYDKNGNIYIPTELQGLFVIRCLKDYEQQIKPSSKDVLHFSYQRSDPNSIPQNLLAIFCDKTGTMWIGTRGGGLIKIITSTEDIFLDKEVNFEQFTEEDGLSDNIVLAIQEDDNNCLWISTANGLTRYNYKENLFTTFYAEDGLSNSHFFWYASHKDKQGVMYFGTTEGINYFHPDSIHENKDIPKVLITDLKILNKSVKVSSENAPTALSLAVGYTPKIVLSHKDNIFSFDFSASNYSVSHKNQYAFMLEGFDNDWIYVNSDKRTARYTNIPGGSYKFKVKASNNDGIWNEKGHEIEIVITPPFVQTMLFRLIVGVLVILFVIFFYFYRVKKLKSQTIHLEEKVSIRTTQLINANNELKEKNEKILTQYSEIENKNEEIRKQNVVLEEQKSKIEVAYKVLEEYQNNLEEMIEDRTKELVVAKEKAEQSDRLKSAFLANMSHEIRTPLNAIMGFSSLIAISEYSQDELAEMDEIIQSNGRSLLQLVNDIIDISMIEANQLDLVKERVEINRLMIRLLNQFKGQIKLIKEKKDIDVQLDVLPEYQSKEIFVFSDADRLAQIFTILFSNALKFTTKGHIRFGFNLNEINNKIEFFMEDTGIGIEEKNLSKIFDRFRKIEEGKGALYRGAGLGLSISSNLVALLGGSIHVESQFGVGSRFMFDVPFEQSNASLYHEFEDVRPKVVNVVDWSDKKILIAEDEESNYLVLRAMLMKTKVKIVWVKNGQQAVDALDEVDNDFNLVLMDIKMPVLDGAEATQIIKSKFDIPILAQTAYATTVEMRKYKEYGFDDYLSKPLNSKLLIFKISQFIR